MCICCHVYLFLEIAVKVCIHRDGEYSVVGEVRFSGVRYDGSVVIGECVELIHHISTGRLTCTEEEQDVYEFTIDMTLYAHVRVQI